MHRKDKKKRHIGLIIFIVFLLIIIIAGIGLGSFIGEKLSNLNIHEIDKTDLGVNSNLYNEISDDLSKQEFNNIVTFALFGIDSADGAGGRSDTIIIASVNKNNKSIKFVSIPRDTYVSVPGYGNTKINHSYAYGKEALAIKTLNENFGLNITEYVSIDFSGLIHIINKLGGLEVNITKEEMDYINKFSLTEYKVSGKKQQLLSSYGNVTLTGEQALTHARNRTIGDDFTRAGRQREVLELMLNKMMKMGASKLLDMSDDFLKEVKTNINIMSYAGLLADIAMNSKEYFSNILSVQIPSTEYGKGDMSTGIYYFKADPQTMRKDMIDTIYTK